MHAFPSAHMESQVWARDCFVAEFIRLGGLILSKAEGLLAMTGNVECSFGIVLLTYFHYSIIYRRKEPPDRVEVRIVQPHTTMTPPIEIRLKPRLVRNSVH
jgi:hypothetical protein